MKLFAYAAFLFKDLFYDLGRSLLTVVSLTAVLVSYLAASAIANVFREYGSQPQAGSGELLILAENALEPMQSKMDPQVLQAAAEIVRQKFGSANLRSAFPVIYRTLEINDRTMQVMAIPQENMRSSYDLALQAGAWPAADNEIAVTAEGMELNHWSLGDDILLRGSHLRISGRVQEKTVTSVIWMLYSGGQKLFDVQNEFQIGVLMLDGSLDLPTVQASLEGEPAFPEGYAVYTNRQLYGRYNELVSDLVRVASIISILALVVIIFGSFNAASLTMTERKQDIAILRTIGFKSGLIRLFLLGRTLVQALLAFLLAWGVVTLLVNHNLKDPVIFFARIAVLHLSTATIIRGFLLTILSASLGVWMVIQGQSRQTLAGLIRE